MEAILKIAEVECAYGAIKALKGITLEVKPADFVGIIGPNGSGKTTLLRTISKSLKPTKGVVLLQEEEIYRMPQAELAKRLAVVPQESSTEFQFSALEIVLMGRTPHIGRLKSETQKDIAIAKEAMRLTNTSHLQDRLIAQLSGGERQRVIIARALAQEPEIILLDEPTVHLDISHQIEILDLIKKLNLTKGITVLAVLHDLNLASAYCDYLVLLKAGRIFALGPPEAVITPQTIQAVYGTPVMVRQHPATGRPYVTLLPKLEKKKEKPPGLRVHIICGGGSGSYIINQFHQAGYKVTVGAVNVDDTDQQVAEWLDLERVEEAPFSPISEESYKANCQLVSQADVVILTDIPFGYGNIRNLQAAEFALKLKKPLLLIGNKNLNQRDFTQGEASDIFLRLLKNGAKLLPDASAAFEEAEKLKKRCSQARPQQENSSF